MLAINRNSENVAVHALGGTSRIHTQQIGLQFVHKKLQNFILRWVIPNDIFSEWPYWSIPNYNEL